LSNPGGSPAFLSAVLMNNHRLNDIKESLRAEIKASEGGLREDIAELRKIEKNHSELPLK